MAKPSRLEILVLIVLLLQVLHIARDIYKDYLWAKCEERSLLGEAGPCTAWRMPP